MRILLVEDTEDIGEAIVARLSAPGHTVDWARTAADARELLDLGAFDLVVLDVVLPDGNGFEILRMLRRGGRAIPVLMLTARSTVADRVDGLDGGADDYLVKPFDFDELAARVRVLIRRGGGGFATNELRLGNVVLDRAGRSVSIDGQLVDLTRREFALLETLAARPSRIFSKTELAELLFGLVEEPPSDNAIEQMVARLRRKLADAGSVVSLHTLRGLGYRAGVH